VLSDPIFPRTDFGWDISLFSRISPNSPGRSPPTYGLWQLNGPSFWKSATPSSTPHRRPTFFQYGGFLSFESMSFYFFRFTRFSRKHSPVPVFTITSELARFAFRGPPFFTAWGSIALKTSLGLLHLRFSDRFRAPYSFSTTFSSTGIG